MIKKINNWKYSAEIDKNSKKWVLSISPNREIAIPKKLYKYYGLSEYSVDAVVNKYLYASHPFDLNDPFDCFYQLVSFDNVPLDMCVRFMKLFSFSEDKTRKLYQEDKQKMFATIEAYYYDYIYSKMGIISTTDNQLDIKMWAYYTGHRGFQVSFKTSSLSDRLHGPFPINYVESSGSIGFSDNAPISVLFQTNIKSKEWVTEKEWRFVYESPLGMHLPNRPSLSHKLKERKAYYQQADVNEVVFGFSFFDKDLCVDYANETAIYDFSESHQKENISKLLSYVIDNKINTSIVHLMSDLNFKLTKRQVKISKLDQYRYFCKKLE